MTEPCEAIKAGKTVESLAKGYVHNTECVHSYEKLLEQQRQYKQDVKKIYGE